MSTPDEILRGLDPEQRRAATALHGPVCILAGAGTGKTRAITHRIAYGVASGVFDPHRTLALTFTARAAAEMRTRLRDLGVAGVQARTFHSAALRQLQYFWPQAVGGSIPDLVTHKARLIAEAAGSMRLSSDRAAIRDLFLLTAKPVLYIANVLEDGFENNPHLDVVNAIAEEEGAIVVPVCNKIEAEIAELDDLEEMQMFLETMGMDEPGLNRVIRAGYELLNLQTYFTAGVKEVRAWTVKVGATAPQAAGVIHTDFEKGFIRAEVIAYDDFIQYKGEAGAKEAGKWRLEGKEYIVKDGDVMHFRFNV